MKFSAISSLLASILVADRVIAQRPLMKRNRRNLRTSSINATDSGDEVMWVPLPSALSMSFAEIEPMASAAAAPPAPEKVSKSKSGKHSKTVFDREEPVVIIGGGIAGTYLAWRLASAEDSSYSPSDINIYERTDHISGRLLSPSIGTDICSASEKMPDVSHVPRTELGGMRIRSKDKIVLGIAEELGIQLVPFYMNSDDETNANSQTNPVFARNVLGTRSDFESGNMLPFTVKPQEFDLTGNNNGLFTPVFENQPEDPSIDPDEYNPCDGETNKDVLLTEYGPNDEPFYSYSLQEHAWTFDGKYGDSEKFDEAIKGYATESFEIGVGHPEYFDGVPPEGFKYVRPLQGMESIPLALNDVAMELGVASNLNQEVTKVEEVGERDWLVTLRETVTSPCTGITIVKDDGATTVVRTGRVVLALPAAALKRIEFVLKGDDNSNHRLDLTIKKLTREVTAMPLMKLFASWPSRWWNQVNNLDTFSLNKDPELKPGRSTSFTAGVFTNDLTSNIFSWYPGTQSRPETVMEKAEACKDMGVIQLYIMPDRLPKFVSASQIHDQVTCAHNDDNCEACETESSDGAWFKPGISTRLVKLLSLDLSTVFRFEVPDASAIMYRIWSGNDPVTRTDAVHFWRAGIKWWERYQDALQPLGKDNEGGTIHIIGETFSYNQGWAEGAVETAEHLLQEVLEMAGPSWLKEQDYCKSNPFFVNRSKPLE